MCLSVCWMLRPHPIDNSSSSSSSFRHVAASTVSAPSHSIYAYSWLSEAETPLLQYAADLLHNKLHTTSCTYWRVKKRLCGFVGICFAVEFLSIAGLLVAAWAKPFTFNVQSTSSLLLLSSIISMMTRLSLDVCFCPTPEPLLIIIVIQLLCFHIFFYIVHPFLHLSSLVSFPIDIAV